ncbi:ATP-binding protein [Bradyrhizobium sp. HKCCYLS1011]|uniref:ATP-binding protein n=1 Tax=Bradyrhizobium sp. HKCCYLS1011 TaxID=3420733 RepID=UPI003EC14B1D
MPTSGLESGSRPNAWHGHGLSICRSMIDAHGGQLWVTADKGRGAVFQFTVPVDRGYVTAERSSA